MTKTRTFIPCRRCGNEHKNPRSSSLCETCGPKVAKANRLREEEREAWNDLPHTDEMLDRIYELETELAELKDKLAKAVGALGAGIACTQEHYGAAKFLKIACTTLAELTEETK